MQGILGDVDGGHHQPNHPVSVLVPGLSDKAAGTVAFLYDLLRAFGEGHADGDRHQPEIGAQLVQVDAEIHHTPAEAQASLGEGGLDVGHLRALRPKSNVKTCEDIASVSRRPRHRGDLPDAPVHHPDGRVDGRVSLDQAEEAAYLLEERRPGCRGQAVINADGVGSPQSIAEG